MKKQFFHVGDTVKILSTDINRYKVIEVDNYHGKLTLQLNNNEPFEKNKVSCIKIQTISDLQQKIIDAVCLVFQLSQKRLLSKSRLRPIPDAKKICWLLMENDYTQIEIGEIFGCNHPNISIGIAKAKIWLQNEPKFKDQFERTQYFLNK